MRQSLIAATLCVSASIAQSDTLTVYAPDYFASEWGPGPAIKQAFESTCACTIEFVTGDVLPRLLLEGARTRADVVIGLTTDVTQQARNTGLFLPHGQDVSDLTMPIVWDDTVFLPFNWTYTAFVYDKTRITEPPASFDAFLAMPDDVKVVIQDPRTSVAGLSLLLWVKAIYGDNAQAVWAQMAPKILTVTAGWSEAYGMFTSGEADMVLSFTTSPAYHIIAEGDRSKAAAIFDEGHYVLTEVAGQLSTSDQPELAQAFMDFILTPAFQRIIPTGNWSYPARLDRDDWPEEFSALGEPPVALVFSEEDAANLRAEAVEEWQTGLSR